MREYTSSASTSHNYNEVPSRKPFVAHTKAGAEEPKSAVLRRPPKVPARHCPPSKEEGNGNGVEMEVPCMNCMRMVRISLVGTHSLQCSKVESRVKLLDQSSVIQQVDYKLNNLKETLIKLNATSELRGTRYYTQMLLEYCEDILAIADYTKTDILHCREVIHNLNALIKGFKGSQYVSIQMERLSATAKEKYGQLLKYYKEIVEGKSDMRVSRKELEEKVEARSYRLRETLNVVSKARSTVIAEARYQSAKKCLSPSDTLTSRPNNKVKFTGSTVEASLKEKEDLDPILTSKEEVKEQEATMKRYFHTIVSNAKKVLGNKHIGYYADSALLFSEVTRLRVSVELWPEFVLREISNSPTKWIEHSKLVKLQELYCSRNGCRLKKKEERDLQRLDSFKYLFIDNNRLKLAEDTN